jgi:hypothetical protein
MRAANALALARAATFWAGIGVASLLTGALASGRADAWLGKTPALVALAGVAGAVFFILFAFLGALTVVVWPVAATVGYLLQVPRSQPAITFDRVWIGGMLAYIALNGRSGPRSRYTLPLIIGLVWLVVSFGVRSFTVGATISGPPATWMDAILLPAILFVACERYCSLGADRVRRLMGAIMIAGGVLGAIGIAERIWGFELATVTGGDVRFDAAIDQTRISGPYPVPEPYALTLIICLAATLYWMMSCKPGDKRGWAIVFAAVQVGAIALTLFRAAWIGGILVLVAAAGIRPGRFGRSFAVVALVGLLAVAVAPQLEHNKTITKRAHNTDNVFGRLATYEQGFQIFRSAPLFGIGVNEYHDVAQSRPPVTVSGVESVPYPHSSFIGLLAEQGIVGLLPLLLLLYAVWNLLRGLRVASFWSRDAVFLTATVAGAALGFLIMSLTLTMLPYSPSNLFFAALLGAAAGRLDTLLATRQDSSS